MKYLVAFIFAVLSTSIYSQVVTLEHTYTTTPIATAGVFHTVTTSSGFRYYTFNISDHTFTIYDEQHQFYKTVNLPLVQSDIYKCVATDKLFNEDAAIEFLITIVENGEHVIILVNEDGELLQHFGPRFDSMIYRNGSNYKLILTDNSYPLQNVDVYSLPGTLSLDQQSFLTQSFAFPNPSDTSISIIANLKSGENGTVTISNLNGQTVMKTNVEGSSDGIMLDISNLSSGVYIYTINGVSKKFIKK